MGGSGGASDERPAHDVHVAPFSLGKTEVTAAQYRKCVDAGACTAPDNGANCNSTKFDRDNPVNCVDWNQARKFAEWVGGALPSEAQWEYAARSGGRAQKYPWGDVPEPSCAVAVGIPHPGKGAPPAP